MSNSKAKQMMADLNKLLGAGSIQMASDPQYRVSYWPTGLLPIDMLLQGGLARGRFTEIFGAFSTLKSYVGLCTIAQTQAAGGTCAVIDTEHSFDEEWAASVGVNTSELLVMRPPTGEKAMDSAHAMVLGEMDFIMFDSIAATLPQAENNKQMDGNNLPVARQAALMSAACRKLTAANKNTAILWINQTRTNVGQMFGNPEVTSGGKAIQYYASYRLRMSVVESMKRDIEVFDGDKNRKAKEQYGQKFKAEVVKSKLSAPFRDLFFNWDLETGRIDIPSFLMAQGLEHGLITNVNATWQYKDLKVRGKDAFKNRLASDPEICLEIENTLRRKSKLPEIKQSAVSIMAPSEKEAAPPAPRKKLSIKRTVTK